MTNDHQADDLDIDLDEDDDIETLDGARALVEQANAHLESVKAANVAALVDEMYRRTRGNRPHNIL